MTRVSVYIDGGPFLDGVRGQGMSMDMDFRAVVAELATEAEIGAIHYFVAVRPETPYPAKYKNQFVLFDRLKAQGIVVHQSRTQLFGSVFIDRGTEAALATRLVADAYENKFERALLVSKREDFASPVAGLSGPSARRSTSHSSTTRWTPPIPCMPIATARSRSCPRRSFAIR